MKIDEIVEWLRIEFLPLPLATAEQTIYQIVNNAIRYFNNNSAIKMVQMVPVSGQMVPVPRNMKSVAQVYPSLAAPMLNVQDFPLWTLLGIQVLDGLTTDLIMLMETYKSFMIYMGKDFHWSWTPADENTTVSISGESLTGSGVSWTNTLRHTDISEGTLVITGGAETFTDDGDGVMVSNLSGGTSGTIDYVTGEVALTWVSDPGTATAVYDYYIGGWIFVENVPAQSGNLCVVGARKVLPTDDVTHNYILDFLLRYSKALLKLSEGNLLRKSNIINVANDGQDYITEGKEEIEKLKEELRASGRWLTFLSRG